MSATEERLVAALAARAEQVQPEDLRAPEVPDGPRAVSFLRHPAAYAVGIAAAAAAIVAPFVIGGLGSDDAPVPPTTHSPSPTLAPQPDIGRDWPVTQALPADLDGDGTKERVRVRADGDRYTAERLRLETELSDSGEGAFGLLAIDDTSYHLTDWLDVDSDGDQELLVWVGNKDERPEVDLRVLDLVDGQLVELEQRGDVEIQSGPVLDRRVDDRVSLMFETAWWVDDGNLHSSRSVDSYAHRGMTQDTPEIYRAEVWVWQQAEPGVLSPVSQEMACMANGPEGPEPVFCPPTMVDVPELYPELTGAIGVGESFERGYVAGEPDTIALEGDGSGVDFVTTSSSAGEQRLGLPAGEPPIVYTSPVNLGTAAGPSFLVAQESGGTSSMTLVTKWRGKPVAAAISDGAPFGTGRTGQTATPYRTWIGPGDIIFTSVAASSHPDDPAARIYTWTLVTPLERGDPPALEPIELGTFCTDSDATPPGVTRCDG